MKPRHEKGLPIVLSAPSGGGKTTIAETLLRTNKNLVRSISTTTRTKRRGEMNGVDYVFVNEEIFRHLIRKRNFMEWALVHGHYYGTPIKPLLSNLKRGKDVLLVIDPQGAVKTRKIFPHGVYIFVVPPNWATLRRRLKGRGPDNKKTVRVRLKNAKRELNYLRHYDFVVINDRLDQAVADVRAIVRSEHLNLTRVNKKAIRIFN